MDRIRLRKNGNSEITKFTMTGIVGIAGGQVLGALQYRTVPPVGVEATTWAGMKGLYR